MTTEKPERPDNTVFLGRGVRIDAKSRKLDRVFFRRLWDICRPFWTRQGAWRSYALVGVIVAIGLVGTAAGGFLTLLSKDVNNALVAKEQAAYWSLWIKYSGLGLLIFLTTITANFFESYLEIEWRRWMTGQLIDDYLGARTYYEITLDGDIDNPDQRIQEEMKPVIDAMTRIPNNVFNSITTIGVQVAILASIAMPMLVATLVYCSIYAVYTYFINKPTIKQNWEATVAEADLRFGLLHVRDHAETIAFYRGENGERVHLFGRLTRAIAAQWAIAVYAVKMVFASRLLTLVWQALPVLFVAPMFFRGEIEFGVIAAATTSALQINVSLLTFIGYIPLLTKCVPHVVRVAEIREKFKKLAAYRQAQHIGHLRHETSENSISFEGVTLMTPGGERTLFSDVSLELAKGGRMLIAGPTGTGKSSALRAMAGLWNLGHGTIRTPPEEKTLYLPQRPYMVLGSLRHQLLYPGNAEVPPTDEEIVAALRESCLEELADRYPDLSAEADWGRILSLGEQQRIGVARALLTKAEYLFVDEATSAVDVNTERRLYTLLLSRKVTLVSVGHRPTLYAYHDIALELRPDGTGEVMPIDQYLARQTALQEQPVVSDHAAIVPFNLSQTGKR